MPTRRAWLQSVSALGLSSGLWATESLIAQTPAAPTAPKAPAKPDIYADAVFEDHEPPAIAAGSYTMAILPDTQNYSEKYPEQFHGQTDWIVANKEKYNIRCMIQLGDITNRNSETEWKNAVAAVNKLDGHVPYFLNLGNHDYSKGGGCTDRNNIV